MARLAKEPRRFLRTAQQRLQEAQFLLQNDYATASVYLAGYAIECMLKVLILASEPQAHHPKTMNVFSRSAWTRFWLAGRPITSASNYATQYNKRESLQSE